MSLTPATIPPDPERPVDPERPGPERPVGRERPGDPQRQLSLFGVEAADPSPADLAGLLAGPGRISRMGGTARVSVDVDAAWRVHVLVAEFALRGLAATWAPTAEGQLAVHTAYTSALAPLGAAWLRGGGQRPPARFFLSGPRLRLWVAAAGSVEPPGFLLRLGPTDEGCWEAAGAALAAVGLPGALLGPRAGGPGYRITGRRRLARLAELVGDRPAAAPRPAWPAV